LTVLTNGDDKSDLVISIVACCHRQTFLFNIWKNQRSGGEWLHDLQFILPREKQVELHRRYAKIYRIVYTYRQERCRQNHRT